MTYTNVDQEYNEVFRAGFAAGVAAERNLLRKVVNEWRYALVDGNTANEPIPREVVEDLLDTVECADAAAIQAEPDGGEEEGG